MMKLVKDWVRATCRSMGYEILPLREVKDRDFAIHLRRLLDFFEIDCIFDVGANIGQYHDFLRNMVLYKGTIVSFEPVARHVEILKSLSQADRNWRIEGYALGSKSGQLSINVMKSDQFSSFREPDNSRIPAFAGLNDTTHSETVDVRTLNDVLPALQGELGFQRVYLKLDTQGFDIEALRGGDAVLASIPALQTEASVIGIYKDMPDYKETLEFLSRRGFDVSGFYPVSRDDALRVIEFDCVMVNRHLAQAAH